MQRTASNRHFPLYNDFNSGFSVRHQRYREPSAGAAYLLGLKGKIMKLIVSTFLTATLMSTSAMAFEFTGGSLVLIERGVDYKGSSPSYWENYGQTEAQGTIAYSFGNGLGGQAGFSLGTYEGDDNYKNFDLHLTYAVDPNVTIGAFIGSESYDFDRDVGISEYSLFGAEIAYTKNALSVQTAFVAEKNTNDYQYSYKALVIDAVYGLTEQVSLTGGVHLLKETRDDEDGSTLQYAYIGATYAVAPMIDLGILYGELNDVDYYSQSNLALSLTYKFRSGAIFQQRAFNSVMPGL